MKNIFWKILILSFLNFDCLIKAQQTTTTPTRATTKTSSSTIQTTPRITTSKTSTTTVVKIQTFFGRYTSKLFNLTWTTSFTYGYVDFVFDASLSSQNSYSAFAFSSDTQMVYFLFWANFTFFFIDNNFF
jgi:hypothetical protein